MASGTRHRAAREEFERDAMRLLCSELIQPETRLRLAGMLKGYVFSDGLNRAVFESVLEAGAVRARELRELLPGRVAIRGFPELQWKQYLGRNGAEEDIDKLFESLLELTEVRLEKGEKAMGQSA
jgi:hypothetical protein